MKHLVWKQAKEWVTEFGEALIGMTGVVRYPIHDRIISEKFKVESIGHDYGGAYLVAPTGDMYQNLNVGFPVYLALCGSLTRRSVQWLFSKRIPR